MAMVESVSMIIPQCQQEVKYTLSQALPITHTTGQKLFQLFHIQANLQL